eukprot:TRINITY_DN635_c0_g1_i1.p1 TRINITY_DN635_c0_g1~~TRINITY_DN635_c0_g1_i1.p1  ORF type:complete len:421 (-),score=126.87 TRINITY_DN635_c0_g1_i1:31-1293(-)
MSKSFIQYQEDEQFPIQNLPYGVFRRNKNEKASIGVRIANQILDLRRAYEEGLFKEQKVADSFEQETLNKFMSLGKTVWSEVRKRITELLSDSNATIRDNKELQGKLLVEVSKVEMLLPSHIGDYTDFYASRQHATNVGIMFRGKENALMPNWLHIPIGYHGRSSSIVVSGTDLKRPNGQKRPNDDLPPVWGPCGLLDFELEIGCFVGPGNELGEPIKIENAGDHLFGIVILNDWSARDIQKWEYVPLGPFCGKNFGSSISPWVVTMEALEPFLIEGEKQVDPEPLPYLKDTKLGTYDLNLFVDLKSQKMENYDNIVKSNFKYMYWSLKQQLVQHTSTGCNMRPGDMIGSGTISGNTREEFGSMLEISWKGTNPLKLTSGEERKFLQDGDTVRMSGYAQANGYRIGLGEVVGTILKANEN